MGWATTSSAGCRNSLRSRLPTPSSSFRWRLQRAIARSSGDQEPDGGDEVQLGGPGSQVVRSTANSAWVVVCAKETSTPITRSPIRPHRQFPGQPASTRTLVTSPSLGSFVRAACAARSHSARVRSGERSHSIAGRDRQPEARVARRIAMTSNDRLIALDNTPQFDGRRRTTRHMAKPRRAPTTLTMTSSMSAERSGIQSWEISIAAE